MCFSLTVKFYTAKIKQTKSFDNQYSTNKIEIFIRVDYRKRHRNFAAYYCCIHIFSAELLICSQTFINLKRIQKLEILYGSDIRFHTIVGKSNLSCFTDCTKHASAGTLTHRQQTIYWIFTQTKLSSIYRHKLYCHLFGFDKTSSVTYNSDETQTFNYYFFYCSVEIDSGQAWTQAKSSQACGKKREEGNFEVLKRCYIQIYPTSFLLCFGKAVNLEHM